MERKINKNIQRILISIFFKYIFWIVKENFNLKCMETWVSEELINM